MTDRELMQQALETLEWHLEKGAWGADIEGVTAALRERLAQPERQWQGLTSTELREVYIAVNGKEWCLGGISDADSFCKAVEAKLKEKNT